MMKPIAHIETPFIEKFGIPRQPLLINGAWGRMDFPKNDFFAEAFRGLENFSHLWLIFSFHEAVDEGVKALVRPPRFGGDLKWGVFATRSPHRPNHLGLSVVKFKKIEFLGDKISLWVDGVDLLSGTPIFDIKPYLPYADSVSDAQAGAFQDRPELKRVQWDCLAPENDEVRALIEKVIALDPRPSFDQYDSFGVSVAGYNVRFQWQDSSFMILECKYILPEQKI